MSMFDSILGQAGENPIVQNLAAKVGLSPDQVAGAVAALTQAHTEPGDTVDSAAQQTGLPTDTLNQLLEHLGGEGALSHLAGALGGAEGEGGLSGMLGKLGGLAGGPEGEGGMLGKLGGLFGGGHKSE